MIYHQLFKSSFVCQRHPGGKSIFVIQVTIIFLLSKSYFIHALLPACRFCTSELNRLEGFMQAAILSNIRFPDFIHKKYQKGLLFLTSF